MKYTTSIMKKTRKIFDIFIYSENDPENVHFLFQDSPCEQVIARDINRTFPAHDYFKETGGVGQDSLFKISKV